MSPSDRAAAETVASGQMKTCVIISTFGSVA
jgi:hypothetical protein